MHFAIALETRDLLRDTQKSTIWTIPDTLKVQLGILAFIFSLTSNRKPFAPTHKYLSCRPPPHPIGVMLQNTSWCVFHHLAVAFDLDFYTGCNA